MKKKLFSEIPYLESDRLILKGLTKDDAPAMRELVDSPGVYRYLPTFLFEKQYPDVRYVIDHLYDECWKESIILGVFEDGAFCGLAEMYGYRDPIHKISVGYRLLERCWGKGIASAALGMMIDYLYNETDIEIITASTMVENQASARVLTKNGFQMVVHAVDEDWGFERPTVADKWIR
ncbi:MAG: GNAT family N-acetyltransferase [Firmicutes bacterium]|nr:GNAT family N-acetyltransferase [Bacillota bacterium]